jgi:transposase
MIYRLHLTTGKRYQRAFHPTLAAHTLALLAGAAPAARAQDWAANFNLPGVNDRVRAITQDAHAVYYGGDFTTAGTVAANRILSSALVLCVDEKSQIEALDRTASLLPLRPSQAERGTHDYRRHGTTTLFAALDVKTGQVLSQTRARHRAVEFRTFLDLIDANVPPDLDIHIILDNYGTHKTAIIRNWFPKRPRYHLHFTPTYGSWLNMVERWFAGLTNRQLRRGVHRSIAALERAIRDYIKAHNAESKPSVWTKPADEILASIARFAARTLAAQA